MIIKSHLLFRFKCMFSDSFDAYFLEAKDMKNHDLLIGGKNSSNILSTPPQQCKKAPVLKILIFIQMQTFKTSCYVEMLQQMVKRTLKG